MRRGIESEEVGWLPARWLREGGTGWVHICDEHEKGCDSKA